MENDKMKIEIWFYRLMKEYRSLGLHYSKKTKTIEISLYFWNTIIIYDKEEEIK